MEPLPGTANHPGMDRLWVTRTLADSGETVPGIAVGDIISILYDGMVAETYPGQINRVYNIQVLPEHPDTSKEPLTNAEEWEVTMEVSDATPTGAVVRFYTNCHGIGELTIAREYHLEMLTDTGWVHYGYDPTSLTWDFPFQYKHTGTEEDTISDGTLTHQADWSCTASVPLAPGTYRYCTQYTFARNGDAVTHDLYAEFTITEDNAAATDPPGTYYRFRTAECLYLNPLSSQAAWDDNGRYYIFDSGMFRIVDRSAGNVLFECSTADSQWEDFPFTQERWEELLPDGYDDLAPLRELLWGAQYRKLSDNYCLFLKDGTLYVAYGFFDTEIAMEYFWEIYELTLG